MPKDQEKYSDLLKIPDEILIKQLRFELGLCHSEIDELRYNLEQKTEQKDISLSPGRRTVERENKNLKIKVDALTNTIWKLNNELIDLKRKLNII